MLFSATWRQKSQKIDFMNVFHGFIGFGSETANIFNTCMAQGAYIVQYIVNSCRGCWQYTISIVAGIKNHIFTDPYISSTYAREHHLHHLERCPAVDPESRSVLFYQVSELGSPCRVRGFRGPPG